MLLVTLPALLATGLPPHVVLGTNKGQSVFGAFAALVRFYRAGLLNRQLATVTFPLGLVGSFLGAGLVLLIIAFSGLLGHGLTKASADAKVVNFASNLAAVSLFAYRGLVLWYVALPMAAAQFTGGWIGAHLAVRGGDKLVRRVVLLVVTGLVLKLGRDVLTQ